MLSVRQGTQHFTDENKVSRKWSDSVYLLPFQLNKNNTITHQVLFVKIQKPKSIKLSYYIYYKTHSQTYMRPTINFNSKPVQCLPIVCWSYNNCSIVPFPCSIQCSMFTHLVFYITELHKIQVRSQLNFSKISKAKWTPVLINKIWYYRMLQKSSQVVSEQILTLHFRCPSFSANHLFNVAPNVKWCSFSPVLCLSEAGGPAACI